MEIESIDDRILLERYVRDGSEEAFRGIMLRYRDLVYGACRRVLGRTDLAEDASQAVFVLLAKKSRSLIGRPSLGGWLYASAVHISKSALRREGTRVRYETLAAHRETEIEQSEDSVAPVLDSALERLRASEREAIVLRFFQDLSFKELGTTLHIGEDSARMRVNRGMESLRRELTRAGLAVTVVGLAAALPRVGEAAPDSLLKKLGALHFSGPVPPHLLNLMKGNSRIMSPILQFTTIASILSVGLAGGAAGVMSAKHAGTHAMSSALPAVSKIVKKRTPKQPGERKITGGEGLDAMIKLFPGRWSNLSYTDIKTIFIKEHPATVAYNQSKNNFEIRGDNGDTADWKPDPLAGTFLMAWDEAGPHPAKFVSGIAKGEDYALSFEERTTRATGTLKITFNPHKFIFLMKLTALPGTKMPGPTEVTDKFERIGLSKP